MDLWDWECFETEITSEKYVVTSPAQSPQGFYPRRSSPVGAHANLSFCPRQSTVSPPRRWRP
jgi:hypothetical protein